MPIFFSKIVTVHLATICNEYLISKPHKPTDNQTVNNYQSTIRLEILFVIVGLCLGNNALVVDT